MRVRRKVGPGLIPFVIALVATWVPMAAAQQEGEQSSGDISPPPGATFTDTVEVSVINLYVTVVDRKGNPVTGLTADDFVVKDNGEPMEITNFSAIGTVATGVATVDPVEEVEADAVTPSPAASLPSQVALVFDNPGLEKRQRKRILKALADWVPEAMAGGSRMMVATLDPEPSILTPFTSDPYLVLSAFDEIAQRPTQGDMSKSTRRMLTRSIQDAQTVDSEFRMVTPDENPTSSGSGSGSGGGSGSSGGSSGGGRSNTGMAQLVTHGEMGKQMATQYYAQLEALRRQEYTRIGNSLVGLDWLIRGLTGLPGRKDVLWVTEDLMMQPAVDVYEAYYTKFETWAQDLGIDKPAIWATKLNLTNEFMYIAGVSQVASTVLHVVDASDRDREAASADYGASDSMSHMNVNSAGGGATGGYDLSVIQSQNEGGQYLSSATGGSFFGNSRNFDDYFETLSGLVGAYYSIGYRNPTGAPDGMLHPVSVEVVRDGLKVRTHERVPNPTRDQNLANMAISRLMIDEGPNPLGLRVFLGPTEPAEGDRFIQEIRLQVPAANLMLKEDGPNHVGTLVVAVVASDEKGEPLPPRMLQLTVSLPSERLVPETIALSRLRLMMESGSLNLAVAIRDEGSGTEASARASVGS